MKNEVKRNDPCPCGSGKKYKKCCGQPGLAKHSIQVVPSAAPASLLGRIKAAGAIAQAAKEEPKVEKTIHVTTINKSPLEKKEGT